MVFGNAGDDSGTGVVYLQPSTGEKVLYGEFLLNAQGRCGGGNPDAQPIAELERLMPGCGGGRSMKFAPSWKTTTGTYAGH